MRACLVREKDTGLGGHFNFASTGGYVTANIQIKKKQTNNFTPNNLKLVQQFLGF